MFLVPHLLCLLGLLALDTVHTGPLAEVKLQNGTLALDTVHTGPLAEVKLQNGTLALDIVHKAPSAEVRLQRGSCPMFWYSFNGRCYKYVATHLPWNDAERNCVSEGANLVSIHSVEEHNFVNNLIQNFDMRWTWIGLTDHHKEGWWMWSDGCKVSYTYWDDGQPNNYQGNDDCGSTSCGTGVTRKWCDSKCSSTAPSVCASRTMCP